MSVRGWRHEAYGAVGLVVGMIGFLEQFVR